MNLVLLPDEFLGETMSWEEEKWAKDEMRKFYGRWRWAKVLAWFGVMYDPFAGRLRRMEVVHGVSRMDEKRSGVSYVRFKNGKTLKVKVNLEWF